ncbi:hypothetical protein M440DRAFT_1433486 [Trichoderma longibrachiatum ATCC 18648]|uniref:Uncharacterized protein n=1 Tax=Trichoderma longibrachiatum ATCC 18648 TaxID=983965 RepID=A0A2T4BTR1_TRILO|nr:hypothetical protein M440DRAFT_1433486 [Trichoderma longibrachiatum ATCC 18648]
METESPSDDLGSTQPLSPTGVEFRDALKHVDRDKSSGDDDDRIARADIKETTFSAGAAQRTEKVASNKAVVERALVKVRTVAWTEHDHSAPKQSYSGEGLAFRVVIDASQRTGLIRLQASIQLKHDNLLDGSETIYLFIYPENIRAVTADELLDTLSFSLKRPPDLVVPKGRPLESEPATETLLRSMFALAKVTHFDVQLSTTKLPRSRLKFILSIHNLFAVNHNFSTDKRRADLNTLYVGRGSEVVNVEGDLEGTRDSPPLYEKDTPRSHNQLEVNGRVARIEGDVKQLQSRVEWIDSRVERIEETLASEGSEAPSQTMSEARLELLEELNDRIDHEIIDVQSRYEDRERELEEKIEELETTVTEVLENFQKNVEACEDEAEERMEERIEQAVGKYLRNGTFQGSFLFNAQASADE